VFDFLGLTRRPLTKEEQLAASTEEVGAALLAASRAAEEKQLSIDIAFDWPSELRTVQDDTAAEILQKEDARRRSTLRAGDLMAENPDITREVAFATAILDWKEGRLGGLYRIPAPIP
jgi:hypothetical protein